MVTGLIIGLSLGILITLAVVFFASPSIMFKENKSKHDFDTTVAELEKTVAAKGWVIPNINDLQAALKKFEYDVHKVKVYEICKPELANKILNQDDERIVSSLMPCRIAIYEKSDRQVYLSLLNAKLMSKPMSKLIRETMAVAAQETEEIIEPLFK
jgi:uncharacterized protein (DUF302 family)